MRGCTVLLTVTVAALAQQAPMGSHGSPVTIATGVPLRVALERRIAIKREGEPIQGRLVEPVYVFDRAVLPAGSVVEGHIAEIGGVPVRRRINALLSGNLTPPRDVRGQFDNLILGDGSRIALRTSLSRGTAHTARIAARGKGHVADKSVPDAGAAALAFRQPGKMSQLKSYLIGMLPYHRQAWSAGTLFNSALEAPLTVPITAGMEARADPLAELHPEGQELTARLLNPLNSATARKGATVEALVTRPLFSSDHRLLVPEGSRLTGEVVEARPARIFHRNGKLLFVFRQIIVPSHAAQSIHGYLEGMETDFSAHLTLDQEGNTHVSSPKTRFIFPAIAAAVAGLSFHQDYNAKGVPDADSAGRAESGAVGLGLIGTVVAQASRPLASGIAITGAAFSVYSTFIARGTDIGLPVNTPVTISLRERDSGAAQPAH